MNQEAISDENILNRMFLNRELQYVEGYINIYCEKNKDCVEKDKIFENYESLSDKIKNDWENFTSAIEIKDIRFVKMKNNLPAKKQIETHYSQNNDENSKNIININLVNQENNENNDNDLVGDSISIGNDKNININNSEKADNPDENSNDSNELLNIFYCISENLI